MICSSGLQSARIVAFLFLYYIDFEDVIGELSNVQGGGLAAGSGRFRACGANRAFGVRARLVRRVCLAGRAGVAPSSVVSPRARPHPAHPASRVAPPFPPPKIANRADKPENRPEHRRELRPPVRWKVELCGCRFGISIQLSELLSILLHILLKMCHLCNFSFDFVSFVWYLEFLAIIISGV